MGGTAANRLSVVSKTGNVTVDGQYLALPDINDLCIGMTISGPGVPAGAKLSAFYDSTNIIMDVNANATASGTYTFTLIDGGALGSSAGKMSHTLHQQEMPYHTHGYSVTSGGDGIYGGPHWSPSIYSSTYEAGFDRPHNNLQPTMIMNKIIKYAAIAGVLVSGTAQLVIGDTTQTGNPANSIIVPRYLNHPDKVITSPNAFDDHFEGSTLNAKWAVGGTGGINQTSVAGSHLSTSTVSNVGGGAEDYIGYAQVLPNANNFRLALKLDVYLQSHTVTSSVSYVDLYLYTETPGFTGVKLRFGNYYVSGQGGILQTVLWTGANLANQYANFYGNFPKYFRFVWTRSTTEIKFEVSVDGNSWHSVFFAISTATHGLNETYLPSKFQLVSGAGNYGQAIGVVDWIKFTNF